MEPRRTARVVSSVAVAVAATALGLYLLRSSDRLPRIEPVEPLTASSTQQERLDYAALVTERAVESTMISLVGCASSPLYAKVVLGSEVVFKNRDEVPRTISFSPSLAVLVPAKGEARISGDSFKYRGLWPFTCDSGPSGTLVITQ